MFCTKQIEEQIQSLKISVTSFLVKTTLKELIEITNVRSCNECVTFLNCHLSSYLNRINYLK